MSQDSSKSVCYSKEAHSQCYKTSSLVNNEPGCVTECKCNWHHRAGLVILEPKTIIVLPAKRLFWIKFKSAGRQKNTRKETLMVIREKHCQSSCLSKYLVLYSIDEN